MAIRSCYIDAFRGKRRHADKSASRRFLMEACLQKSLRPMPRRLATLFARGVRMRLASIIVSTEWWPAMCAHMGGYEVAISRSRPVCDSRRTPGS
jgi:hypothetical protein